MARIRGFSRQRCNFGDVRGIGKRARHGRIGSQTLPLARARLGSQTLAVARESIEVVEAKWDSKPSCKDKNAYG